MAKDKNEFGGGNSHSLHTYERHRTRFRKQAR